MEKIIFYQEVLTKNQYFKDLRCAWWDEKLKSCDFLDKITRQAIVDASDISGREWHSLDWGQKTDYFELLRRSYLPSGAVMIMPSNCRMLCTNDGLYPKCENWESGGKKEGVPAIIKKIRPEDKPTASVETVRVNHKDYIRFSNNQSEFDLIAYMSWLERLPSSE